MKKINWNEYLGSVFLFVVLPVLIGIVVALAGILFSLPILIGVYYGGWIGLFVGFIISSYVLSKWLDSGQLNSSGGCVVIMTFIITVGVIVYTYATT